VDVGSKGQRCRALPWIFIHDTDKLEGGLMELFFDLVFTVAPYPPKNYTVNALASSKLLFFFCNCQLATCVT